MKIINSICIYIVKFYQAYISPLLGQNCRYYPSCSSYCIESFEKYNAIYACYLTIKRIFKCNPFGGSGHDPVP
jgi:hypothetical protein